LTGKVSGRARGSALVVTLFESRFIGFFVLFRIPAKDLNRIVYLLRSRPPDPPVLNELKMEPPGIGLMDGLLLLRLLVVRKRDHNHHAT